VYKQRVLAPWFALCAPSHGIFHGASEDLFKPFRQLTANGKTTTGQRFCHILQCLIQPVRRFVQHHCPRLIANAFDKPPPIGACSWNEPFEYKPSIRDGRNRDDGRHGTGSWHG